VNKWFRRKLSWPIWMSCVCISADKPRGARGHLILHGGIYSTRILLECYHFINRFDCSLYDIQNTKSTETHQLLMFRPCIKFLAKCSIRRVTRCNVFGSQPLGENRKLQFSVHILSKTLQEDGTDQTWANPWRWWWLWVVCYVITDLCKRLS
jgi:hypothetical protein